MSFIINPLMPNDCIWCVKVKLHRIFFFSVRGGNTKCAVETVKTRIKMPQPRLVENDDFLSKRQKET